MTPRDTTHPAESIILHGGIHRRLRRHPGGQGASAAAAAGGTCLSEWERDADADAAAAADAADAADAAAAAAAADAADAATNGLHFPQKM
jgi:hypothetical protein